MRRFACGDAVCRRMVVMLARVPECPSARVPECPSARVPECPSARVPECPSVWVRAVVLVPRIGSPGSPLRRPVLSPR
ncbi:hypothetical protein GCM10022206_15050 [Streptomyces chiangmaiensis]